MSKLTILTTEDIFRLRNYLQQISHISYSFSNLNKRYPIETISEEQGLQVITAYRNLLNDCRILIETYQNNLNLNNGKQKQPNADF